MISNRALIEKKLKSVPRKPGVYLLKDGTGSILYVGKAKALRDRLRSHFKPGRDEEPKHRLMMRRVRDFEFIVTDSEVEALILEANFVKEHRPRYNINLKDDKSYPYIRVTDEVFPRVFVTRKIIRDGSRYFGPYTDVGSMRQLIAAIRRIFPVRSCRFQISEETIRAKKHRVCLNYHIGRCRGPCEGLVSREEYLWDVEQVVSFIQGKKDRLVETLTRRMAHLAGERQYEEAARLRDEIRSIDTFHERQKVVDDVKADRDLIAVAAEGEDACCVTFDVRDGKITNRHHFYLDGVEDESERDIISSFVKQYYIRKEFIPAEVFLAADVNEIEELEAWLSGKRGGRVRIFVPRRGKKAGLMDMVTRNARLLLEELKIQKTRSEEWIAPSLRALAEDLRLPNPPKRIEAFDVSNIAGQDAAASMVVFENAKPKKSEYRKFRIKTVQGIDDYQMMAEAVRRRLTRLLREEKPLPDLILVDGGKGQLSTAVSVLASLNLTGLPVIGLAKRLEEVFLPGIMEPQNIAKSSASLRLLQRIRDEAHRFAVAYHRSLRKKRTIASELDRIDGIGELRRKALLQAFGSLDGVKKATVEEIAGVKGMNRKVAERVNRVLGG